LGDVPDEPLHQVMLDPRGFREAADPEAVITPVPYLVPIVETFLRISVPFEGPGIVILVVPFPLSGAAGDRLARALSGTFFAGLAELDDTTGGLGTLGERRARAPLVSTYLVPIGGMTILFLSSREPTFKGSSKCGILLTV
jgi:hypothetical protein